MPVRFRSGWRTAFAAIALALFVTACATDQQRTRTEGTLIGAGAGAAVGRAITGDDRGTLIGSAVGAVAGFLVGNSTAKKKAAYAKREDALRASAQQAAALAQASREENDQLARDIADLEAAVNQLRIAKTSASAKKKQMEASAEKQNALVAAADARLVRLRDEYARQEALVQQQAQGQPAEDLAKEQQASEGFRLYQVSQREIQVEQRRLELAKETLRQIDTRRAF